ncbi:MAG: class I SAM-dependent methyltransferase [Nanoarchaeota archaeon]|nr:class I SAM-dependent methyltransferase [Nanoarchaeota archaeon]
MKNKEALMKKVYSEYAPNEWKRLKRDAFHRLEWDTTMIFLKRYLPKKGLVLDAGGGPGRYTIELAKKGYDVILLDLAPGNLELAKRKIKKERIERRVKEIVEGSITNLSMFKDNSFDAVLCIGGPLSHISIEKERKKVINELARVAKKNAPIFISVMGKYGVMLNALKRWPGEVEMDKHFKELWKYGEDNLWLGGKGYCHFFTIEELEKLVKDELKIIETVGLEGLASVNQEELSKISKSKKFPKAYKNWLDSHYHLCTQRTIANLSNHFLIIGRKK